ncbi:hypothetical protein PoB_007598400 [Plakobranchus ocellatus]|uniref:Uncharacterized protein n=1 Tax=Plakobranchus ocellatus TaxID=259542 RepID=A0AAV4DZ38_9GAST|nr:hypothetical protein PoB_007598400 [Plakobranchus ocellatus]
MISSAHNGYVVAKYTNAEFAARHWPGFQNFLEDLAEDLVANLTTTWAPPILHVEHPCHYLHTLRCRPDGLYKVQAERPQRQDIKNDVQNLQCACVSKMPPGASSTHARTIETSAICFFFFSNFIIIDIIVKSSFIKEATESVHFLYGSQGPNSEGKG